MYVLWMQNYRYRASGDPEKQRPGLIFIAKALHAADGPPVEIETLGNSQHLGPANDDAFGEGREEHFAEYCESFEEIRLWNRY